MSVTIDNLEFEAILADVAASTGRDGGELLVDLLKREQARLARARDVSDAIESGQQLHERWMSLQLIDPRPIDEVLAFDENGLPY